MNLTTVNIPDTLTFVEPIIGFSTMSQVNVTPLDDEGRLFTLRTADAAQRRWFVIEPLHLFPDYFPALPEGSFELLEVEDPHQVEILVIVNPDGPQGATANLLAPVLVNTANGYAAQVVLDGTWPLAEPLPAARPA